MKCITTIILLLVCLNLSAQNTYYVSSAGNDNLNDGKTVNTPFKTFQKACYAVSAGDVVYFRGGTYHETNISCTANGTALAPITFRNYGSETPVFSGIHQNQTGFLTITGSYLNVSGLQFTNLTGNETYGIKVTNYAHHITLSNLKLTNLFFSNIPTQKPDLPSNTCNPILVFGPSTVQAINNVKIENCEVSNCRTGQSEAIAIVGNVQTFTITKNQITNTGNIGIVAAGYYNWGIPGLENIQSRNGIISENIVDGCKSLKALAAGIYIDGARDVIVERNISRNGQRGFAINSENHHSVTNAVAINNIIRSNLAYNNSRGGISIGSCKGPSPCTNGQVKNSLVINNTTYNNYNSGVLEPEETSAQDFGELRLDASDGTVLRNNIFTSFISDRWNLQTSYQNGSSLFVTNYTSDYNIWHFDSPNWPVFQFNNYVVNSLGSYKSSSTYDQNSQAGNPNFKNRNTGDFRLNNESSIAFDFGDISNSTLTNLGEKDLNNNVRFKHFRPDAGAYEYGCISSNITVPSNLNLSNYYFETMGTIHMTGEVKANQKITLKSAKSVTSNPVTVTRQTGVLEMSVGTCP